MAHVMTRAAGELLALVPARAEGRHVIHRDLAARNLLLSGSNHVKICDFGLTRSLSQHESQYTVNHTEKVPFAWYAYSYIYTTRSSYSNSYVLLAAHLLTRTRTRQVR